MTAAAKKKPGEAEQEPKAPTRAQADKARIDQREAAYREGFGARQKGEARHGNPHTRFSLAKQAAGLRMYAAASQERPYTAREQKAWVDEWVPRMQAARESWWDGWDTAERTAATRGEDFLRTLNLENYPRRTGKVQDAIALEMFPDEVKPKGWKKKRPDAMRET